MNRKWQAARRGVAPAGVAQPWPRGSIGEAFARWRQTETWARMEPRTREDWLRGQALIEPVFGPMSAGGVGFEALDQFYAQLLKVRGVDEAFRAVKHWRRLWQKMAAMGYCSAVADPSKGLRRITPEPRSETWSEGEAVLLVKAAWRADLKGLACVIAVAWDTLFSPIDVRTLTAGQLVTRDGRLVFEGVNREKTSKPAIGTLSKRTERLLRAYLAQLPADLLPTALLFRNRRGAPYSKDTLGDNFREVREMVRPGDTRRLMDMRRSGAFEAAAGDVDPNALAAKMANTVNSSRALQRTYQPVSLAATGQADEARRRGRSRLRATE